jgi:alcohol dehydrogenase (cytochrome c)
VPRGFIAAFDAASGKELWLLYSIPGAGEPGNETWSGEWWKRGGTAVWTTGVCDADLSLTYWGTENPFPIFAEACRGGDRSRAGPQSNSAVRRKDARHCVPFRVSSSFESSWSRSPPLRLDIT